MKSIVIFIGMLLCEFARLSGLKAGDETLTIVHDQLKKIGEISTHAEKMDQFVVAGNDGWLFFTPELRAISIGKFWGSAAVSVSRATKSENADPLEAITDFDHQLKQAGIELLLVPVPAKLAIYPEPLLGKPRIDAGGELLRLDIQHQKFFEILSQRGINILDLTPIFLKNRDSRNGELFCKTDSHWSGHGVVLAADAIAEEVHDRRWLKQLFTEHFVTEQRQITIDGDLAKMMNETNPAREELTLTACVRREGDRLIAIEPSRASPVLLMGDSHTLIFHDPGLFATSAGLPDHIAGRFGFPVDLIGVRGSGSTTTRIELLRRKDNLNGKKLVIWCFSIREFTESETGWRKVPVIRP